VEGREGGGGGREEGAEKEGEEEGKARGERGKGLTAPRGAAQTLSVAPIVPLMVTLIVTLIVTPVALLPVTLKGALSRGALTAHRWGVQGTAAPKALRSESETGSGGRGRGRERGRGRGRGRGRERGKGREKERVRAGTGSLQHLGARAVKPRLAAGHAGGCPGGALVCQGTTSCRGRRGTGREALAARERVARGCVGEAGERERE